MQLGLLRQGDWAGIAAMAIGLGALQTVLEEGNREDWFGSDFIVRLSVIAAIALPAFLWIELRANQPAHQPAPAGPAQFRPGHRRQLHAGLALYGSSFVLPLYLSQQQGYNAEQIGEVLAWTGIPQLMMIPLVPRLMRMVDIRVLIGIGFALFAASNFMNIHMTMDYAADQLFWANIVRAIGQALVMTPLSVVASAGIEAENAGSASALFNMTRNLGGAIGIATLQTFLVERERFHFDSLGQSVSQFDERTQLHLDGLARHFVEQGVVDPWHKALAVVAEMVSEQAYVMAVSDVYWLLCAASGLVLLTALLLRKPAAAD